MRAGTSISQAAHAERLAAAYPRADLGMSARSKNVDSSEIRIIYAFRCAPTPPAKLLCGRPESFAVCSRYSVMLVINEIKEKDCYVE